MEKHIHEKMGIHSGNTGHEKKSELVLVFSFGSNESISQISKEAGELIWY